MTSLQKTLSKQARAESKKAGRQEINLVLDSAKNPALFYTSCVCAGRGLQMRTQSPHQIDSSERSAWHALLIEADDAYRESIAACMRLAGCEMETVRGLDDALRMLERHPFDLVVWGAGSADVEHRVQHIAEMRLLTEAPLILIAEGFETAQMDLESGVDQRLPKPFIPGALVGSIHAALRKNPAAVVPPATHVETHGMVLDGDGRRLSIEDRHVDFTRREWDLLLILVSHSNRYIGAHDILRLGWHTGHYGAQEVRIYVRRLRRKLEPAHFPCQLLSRRGQGYSLTFP